MLACPAQVSALQEQLAEAQQQLVELRQQLAVNTSAASGTAEPSPPEAMGASPQSSCNMVPEASAFSVDAEVARLRAEMDAARAVAAEQLADAKVGLGRPCAGGRVSCEC